MEIDPVDNERFKLMAAEQDRPIVDQRIGELMTLATQYDPLELLARLTSYQLFATQGVKMSEQGNGTRSEFQVEYCQSLILARPFPQGADYPEPDANQKFIDKAQQLFTEATLFYTMQVQATSANEDEAELRRHAVVEGLHLRGHAYETHIRQTFHDIAGHTTISCEPS